jgi:hypothetical protein
MPGSWGDTSTKSQLLTTNSDAGPAGSDDRKELPDSVVWTRVSEYGDRQSSATFSDQFPQQELKECVWNEALEMFSRIPRSNFISVDVLSAAQRSRNAAFRDAVDQAVSQLDALVPQGVREVTIRTNQFGSQVRLEVRKGKEEIVGDWTSIRGV